MSGYDNVCFLMSTHRGQLTETTFSVPYNLGGWSPSFGL
jgi:hypothetical protein